MGWKMVYNLLGIDEKTKRNLLTFDQNICTVYLDIETQLTKNKSNKMS